jgi:hypothetical protein
LFAGTGAIGRYWQARCVGFEVRSVEGRRLGTVTRVMVHPESQRVHALYVGGPHHADPIVIDSAFVMSVDPWQRLLVVEQPHEEQTPSETATVVKALPAVTARVAPIAWHRALPAGVALAQHVWSGVRSAAPPLRRSASWLGKRAGYAAAFLVWLYGALVYTLARVTARALLFLAVALSGGLRWVAPRLWRSTKKVAVQARDFGARHSVSSR